MDCRAVTCWRKAKALVDSGSELNLVSQLFVKESGWQLRPDGNATEAIDGYDVQAYSSLKITTSITDQNGKAKTQRIEFMAADIKGYDIVLGDPWLQTHNPSVDWIGKTWAYTEWSNPPEPLSASAFFDAASKAKRVYAVRYCPKKSDEPQLPPEYEEYRDVFSEEEADKYHRGVAQNMPSRRRRTHHMDQYTVSRRRS